MSITDSIAPKTTEVNGRKVADRVRRGITLYSEHHPKIRHLGDRVEVPSCSGYGRYVVVLGDAGETCTCRDFEIHGAELGVCKHVVAAMIADAKTPNYRVESRHDSRFGIELHFVVEVRAGAERDVSRRTFLGDAHADLWELRGYGAVA